MESRNLVPGVAVLQEVLDQHNLYVRARASHLLLPVLSDTRPELLWSLVVSQDRACVAGLKVKPLDPSHLELWIDEDCSCRHQCLTQRAARRAARTNTWRTLESAPIILSWWRSCVVGSPLRVEESTESGDGDARTVRTQSLLGLLPHV